jgi:hypothetical protein
MEDEKDGVKVRATVDKRATRWEVSIDVEHPPGALPKVQSFEESHLRAFLYQRAWLAWNSEEREKTEELDPGDAKGVKYNFHFTSQPPPKDAAVSLYVRTPMSVGSFLVPFEFKNLQLP